MQNTSSYYAVPQCDGRIWADWQYSGRGENYPWGASTSRTTLGDASSPCRIPTKDTALHHAIPMSYSLTPPTPSTTDSDASSSSQISMDSIPEYDDMPEIPFVSAADVYHSSWSSLDRPPERAQAEDDCAPSFWTGLIGMRHTASKSSATSSSLAPSSSSSPTLSSIRTTRKRAGSVSSMASSRTRPAPAKSILSSRESVKTTTRRRGAPSVKFLDVPTIHYEEDDDDYHDDYAPHPHHDEDCGRRGRGARGLCACASPPPPKKARGLSGFFSFKWLFGGSSTSPSSSAPPSASPSGPGSRVAPGARAKAKPKTKKGVVPGRPTISGPFPLCETATALPARGGRIGRNGGSSSSAASLRSVKSSASLASARSCGSRLPTPAYWPR